MYRDILVLVVVSVDYEEGSLQVREITTLENLRQPRIHPGVSTNMGEAVEYLREILPRGLPAVA